MPTPVPASADHVSILDISRIRVMMTTGTFPFSFAGAIMASEPVPLPAPDAATGEYRLADGAYILEGRDSWLAFQADGTWVKCPAMKGRGGWPSPEAAAAALENAPTSGP